MSTETALVSLRNDINAEIYAYEDNELVQQAWMELVAWQVDDRIKEHVTRDIEEAEHELAWQALQGGSAAPADVPR
jgi:hypothetical protein